MGAGCRSISRFNELVDSVADKWCYDNCAIGFCPDDKCECDAATKAMVLPVAPKEKDEMAGSPLAATTKAATAEGSSPSPSP